MGSIYEAKDYRHFLISELASPRFARGARARLAEHLGAHMSFISAVLSGKQDFTQEHAIKVSDFLTLDADETHWFLLLINRDRAGSNDLKKYYQGQLDALKTKRSEIQNQVKSQVNISETNAHLYYGAWYNIGIHMGLRNPELQAPEVMAQYLGISREQVKESIKLLEKIGFLKAKGNRWEVQQSRFHMAEHPTALRIHHINWRQAAIRALDHQSPEDLHYSAVSSIDMATFRRLKSRVLNFIKESEPDILQAKDEELVAFNLDLFRVKVTHTSK